MTTAISTEGILKRQIYQIIETLPLERLTELLKFLQKWLEPTRIEKKRRIRGRAKGQIIMRADFDEPLEDFKEYME